MIEVIYKEDKEDQETVQEPFSMPRNVRQIGLTNGDYRIYVEDYVYTFLSSLAEEEKAEGRGMAAVLTGEIQWTADMTCIFVKGAIAADSMDAAAEHIDFSEKVWQQLQDDKEQYFPEQEIVGWFFAQRQMVLEITELFVKVHLRHFGGEKVLMLMEPGEREDAFFRYDNGTMVQLNGYYIYYEKNSQMQTYMIERNQRKGQETSEKVEDKAVRNFRKIIDSKKPEEREEEKTSVFSYAAEEIVTQTETPTPTARAQNREKITATPIAGTTVTVTKVPVPTKSAEINKADTKKQKSSEEKKNSDSKISAEETVTSTENKRETYVIRPGDTLYQISLNRYGTVEAMEQICALNGISANEIIYPGQVIVLP